MICQDMSWVWFRKILHSATKFVRDSAYEIRLLYYQVILFFKNTLRIQNIKTNKFIYQMRLNQLFEEVDT